MAAPVRHIRARARRAGQAMVETVIAVMALSFVFFCAAQYSDILRTKLLLRHAAARAARARTVGMNRYMAEKSARVAMIPAAGRRIMPSAADAGLSPGAGAAYAGRIGDALESVLRAPAVSPEAQIELWRVPAYLNSENESYARGVLDYELWDATSISAGGSLSSASRIRTRAAQTRPRFFGAAAHEGAGGRIELSAGYEIENHAGLYMEDAGL